MAGIRVIIADDHTLLREAAREVIERQGGIQVVAEAADGREAVIQPLRHGWFGLEEPA